MAVATGDPPWAEVYVPQVGSDWHEWAERTHWGMMVDLGRRHSRWRTQWWTALEHPSPAGGDNDTWFAIADEVISTAVRPCVQFSSWDRCDAHMNRHAGDPIRIAASIGLWGDGGRWCSFGTVWRPYDDWIRSRALETEWAVASQWPFHRTGLMNRVYEPDLLALSEERVRMLRERCGWTTRSAMLASTVAEEGDPLVPPGVETDEWWDLMVEEDAGARCWLQAEDDLPWQEMRPHRRPRQRSLFEEVGVAQ